MKITSKGRYAVTAMMDIAINGGEQPVNLSEISKRQKISLSYLEQLFGKLRKNKLVKSIRGPRGGYLLAKHASDITIGDIILSVNENLDASACFGKGGCKQGEMCLSHQLWDDVNQHIQTYLNGITLYQAVGEKGDSTPLYRNPIDGLHVVNE